ncbi:unnamed protein product, partial [Amoebophrya sp. A120]|eukprot:GSA120T00002698001.1
MSEHDQAHYYDAYFEDGRPIPHVDTTERIEKLAMRQSVLTQEQADARARDLII